VQGQSGAASNNPHGSPSPSPHQFSRPPRWSSSLSLCDKLVNLCLWKTYVLELCDTYVGESWYEHRHVCEKLVTFVFFVKCGVSIMYVMIMWYMWWLCDISFVCLDGTEKNKFKRGILVTLPSVKVIALVNKGTPGHRWSLFVEYCGLDWVPPSALSKGTGKGTR
jgi:hypothetical protein